MPYRFSHTLGLLTLVFLPLLALPQEPPPAEKQAPQDQAPTPRLDLYGDPLPEGAVARLGSFRLRHVGPILGIRYTLDGKRIVTTGADGKARVWDAATGEQVRCIDLSPGIHSAWISPDGTRVVTTVPDRGGKADHRIRVVDLEDGAVETDLKVEDAIPGEAFLSEDGSVLLATLYDYRANAGYIRRWSTPGGEPQGSIPTGGGGPRPVAISPAGTRVVIAPYPPAPPPLWDFDAGKEIAVLQDGQGRFGSNAFAFSPDGGVLATGGFGGDVQLFDARTGRLVRKLPRDESVEGGTASSLAFSSSGKLLACFHCDYSLEVWDVETGKPIRGIPRRALGSTWRGPGPFWSGPPPIAFSPDDKEIATVGRDWSVHIWDVATGQEKHMQKGGHTSGVLSLEFSPNGRTLASAGADATVRLWDVEQRLERAVLRHHEGPVRSVSFSRDGRMLATGGEHHLVSIVVANTGNRVDQWRVFLPRPTPIPGRPNSFSVSDPEDVHAVAFAPEGRRVVVSGSHSGTVLLEVGSKEQRILSPGKPGAGSSVPMTVRRDGSLAPLAIRLLGTESPWGRTVACDDNGSSIAFRSGPGRVTICDGRTGHEWFSVSPPSKGGEVIRDTQWVLPDFVETLAITPDGACVLIGGTDGGVRITEISSGEEVSSWKAEKYGVDALSISPDGAVIATAGAEGPISFWDPSTGSLVSKRKGHEDGVLSLAFSPDGDLLASGGLDGFVILWDTSRIRPARDLSRKEAGLRKVKDLWERLAGTDAKAAFDAVWTLAASPEAAVPWIAEQLRVAEEIEEEDFRRHLADLDQDDFSRREAAAEAMLQMGPGLEWALREALEAGVSPEAETRIRKMLDELHPPYRQAPSETLRTLRSIQILEKVGTEEARSIIESIAARSRSRLEQARARGAIRRLEGQGGR